MAFVAFGLMSEEAWVRYTDSSKIVDMYHFSINAIVGTISQCLAKAAEAHGATILTNAPVASISIDRHNTATGVVLQDGTEIKAKRVISGATPEVTYRHLMSEETRKNSLPTEFVRRIETFDYTSPGEPLSEDNITKRPF